MALQDSGEIKFSDIATEYGVSLSNLSLATLSENIGLTPDHAISEFYGKSSGITINDLTNTITTDDGGTSLDITPEDAIYFGGYHFVSNTTSNQKAIFSDDDGISWSTEYGALFDYKAKFTVANDYLIATSTNYVTRYKFGSEPNSTSDTTYFSNIDLYRTRFSLGSTTSRSRAVYYNDHVYYFKNGSFFKWDIANFNGSNIGSLSQTPISHAPLAVGNDGRMITLTYSGSQAYFEISDNEFSTKTITSIPNQSSFSTTPTAYSDSEIITNGNGTWVFVADRYVNGHTFYCYSTDNGDTWTSILDHYWYEQVMTYTLGVNQGNSGLVGPPDAAYYANNRFYIGWDGGPEGSDPSSGGLIFSTDGINLTGIKDVGTAGKAMSFNGSTLVVYGDDKILRFT